MTDLLNHISAIPLIKRLWKRYVRPDDPDVLKLNGQPGALLYFRRFNPRKFEAYFDDDYVPGAAPHPVLEVINYSQGFRLPFKVCATDMTCLHLGKAWMDLIRYDGLWVERLVTDTTTWDHCLIAKGKFTSGKIDFEQST